MEGPFPADVPSVERRCYQGYRDAACRQIALPRCRGARAIWMSAFRSAPRSAVRQIARRRRFKTRLGPRATRLQLGHFAYEPGIPRITHIKGVDEVSLSSYWSDQDQTKRDRDGA